MKKRNLFCLRLLILSFLLALLPSTASAQIILERKYMVNSRGDVHTSWEGGTSDNYAYQSLRFRFDNNRSLQIGYFNAYYWDDSRTTKRQGVYIISYQGDNKIKEWYIEPRNNNAWVNEKIVIDKTGKVNYYSNGNYKGQEMFADLELENATSFVVDIDPYGWWYTHYHYMDDFKLTTPNQTITDNFNDGILNTAIWQNPENPDGVREEDGILKAEQLRTDKDFHLRSHPIDLSWGGSGTGTDPTGGSMALKIWQSDGQVMTISLDDEPKTSYSDGNLIIKTNKTTVTFPLEKVLKYTYVTDPTGISSPQTVSSKLSSDGQTLTFTGLRANTQIALFNMAGQLLRTINSGDQSKTVVSLSNLPVGVYVVKVNGVTFKMMKR